MENRLLCAQRWATRLVVVLGVLLGTTERQYAQLRIIPQESVREAANPTVVEGERMVFDNGGNLSFGTIGEDTGVWKESIEWRSKDGKGLTITQIRSNCSCLVVHWDRRKSTDALCGNIELEYNPKGRIGSVEQKIFVYTTLSESHPTAIVRLAGRVTPARNSTNLYPYTVGPLRLRQKRVSVPSEGGIVRIAVFNSGSTELKVEHDRGLSIGGVGAHTEPRVLKSGAEGDLVIEYKPTKRNTTPPLLHLAGINAPPRESKIEIEIEKKQK